MPTGAELFVDTLQSLGVRQIFTLVGDHLNDILRLAAARGFRILDMRHESAVVHAADVWARTHRAPSVSLVTGGPGHTNSLTGLATAFAAASPVIAISGSRPASQANRGAFQEVDQVAMAAPVTKWAAEPESGAAIPSLLTRAWKEATSGRMGPVHLTLPVDLLQSSVDRAPERPSPESRRIPPPDARDIGRAIELLRAAERPIVIAGSGIWWGRAEDELRRFAELTRLPVYTIAFARGTLPDSHPYSFGYADPSLNRAAARAFREADLFLILGKRIDYRLAMGGTKLLPAAAKFIQVDIHAAELGLNRRLDVAICADVKTTLEALTAGAGPSPWAETEWLHRVRAFRAEWSEELDRAACDTGMPLQPAAVFRELRRALPRDVLYAWDGGDFVHWGRAMLPATTPGGWVRLGPLGTIGAALPNALALQLAHPGKPVAMITGDGSLGFYIAELDTAVRHKLPVVVIVGNDAGWGLERELQGAPSVACELRSTRYDQVMQGFGGLGEHIETIDRIAPAVERAFSSGQPYLLNISIRGVRSPFTRWKLEGK
ncbi:MAG: thiamine pyrophosphate-binding protein [Bryobacteraceae bacterium]